MTFRPTIRTRQDLEDAWRTLMGPLGFSGHGIWLMLIGADDEPFPHLTRIEEAEHLPTQDGPAGFAGVPTEVVHRACDVDLVPVPMDDMLPDSAA